MHNFLYSQQTTVNLGVMFQKCYVNVITNIISVGERLYLY